MYSSRLVAWCLGMVLGSLIGLYAQSGGGYSYSFVELPVSASVAGLGWKLSASLDSSAALGYCNPAMLDSGTNHRLSLQYMRMPASINTGYVAFAHKLRVGGVLGLGVQYLNYGQFIGADEYGRLEGKFSAGEYALCVSYARALPIWDGRVRLGVNLKPVFSHLERYNSFGLLGDIGIVYNHSDRLFKAGLVVKNIGGQLVSYTANGRERMPFEVQAGVVKRLEYVPLSFYVNLQHLTNWNLGEKRGLDELMRHVVLGVDISPYDIVHVRMGYNYLLRQELKLTDRPGMVGFSWGLGLSLDRISVDYAYSALHIAGAMHLFSVDIALGR